MNIMNSSLRGKIIVLLTTMICLLAVYEADAQRSRRSRRPSKRSVRQVEPKQPLAEQWYGISIGNLGVGNSFNLSGKFTYGFEFKDRFSIGPSAKIEYEYINFRSPSPDISLLTYGGAIMGRIKIVENLFAMGEYGYTSFAGVNNRLTKIREGIWYPAIGAGYKSGIGDWTYGIHLLFPLNDRVRDFITAEYWIDFNYKF